ncbi:MAG: ABC transporter permease [Anaerolineales bacterium]|nr:MAG: ABC transporter permease [Anaerolineales bacterium]
MKSISGLYKAQALEFLRDRSSVLFVLLLPVIFGVFFGMIFSDSAGFALQLGIANQDLGPIGASVSDELTSSESDAIVIHSGPEGALQAALEEGDLHALLVFPSSLTENITNGHPSDVVMYYDSANPTSEGLAMGVVGSLLDEINLKLSGTQRLLRVAPKAIQSEPLRAIDFYLPGMLGVALLWLGIFGTAQPVVTQRAAQVYRRLGVTAISRGRILTAEVSWRVTVGMMQAAVFLIVGYFGFAVGVQSWTLFIPVIFLGTLVMVCLGYVLAGVGRTMESSMAIAQMVNFPMMMLSGSIISAEMLPNFLQPIVKVLPLTYVCDLLRQAMVGAPGTFPVWLSFSVLGGWLLISFFLAVRLWKWE